MVLFSIFVASLALASGAAEAFSYPYCSTRYYIPYEKYLGKPITEATLNSNGQIVAKGYGSVSKEKADVDYNGKDLYFETRQIGRGQEGVFMSTDAESQLVNCQRALSGYIAYGRLPGGGKCQRVVLPFLKTYCQKSRAVVTGKIIAGRNARVVKTSYFYLGKGESAAGTEITAKAKDRLSIDSTVKSSVEDELKVCQRYFGWRRTQCIRKARKSKAVSQATINAKGDNIKSKVTQDTFSSPEETGSSTKIFLEAKSG